MADSDADNAVPLDPSNPASFVWRNPKYATPRHPGAVRAAQVAASVRAGNELRRTTQAQPGHGAAVGHRPAGHGQSSQGPGANQPGPR